MAEVTLTLKGDAATRLQRLLKDAAYSSAEAAIADALEVLEENRAGDIDAWLRDVVGPRLDAMRAAPGASLTADQVRERLFGKS
jgi:Arc/MetJ-type ribon-helix-helix transcriptional regulator